MAEQEKYIMDKCKAIIYIALSYLVTSVESFMNC